MNDFISGPVPVALAEVIKDKAPADAYGVDQSMSLSAATLAGVKNGRIFIETGTGWGGGIETALAAGFALVFSIEADALRYQYNLARFAGRPNVVPIFGDSARMLKSVLSGVAEPATIFLDAHTREDSPVMAELAAVLASPYPHTVLIDDMRHFASGRYSPSPQKLADLLAPLFTVSRLPNSVTADDVLCAVSRAK